MYCHERKEEWSNIIHQRLSCEISEKIQNLEGKRKRDSVCVMEQGQNDLTMMEKDVLEEKKWIRTP